MLLVARDISKIYKNGPAPVPVLTGADFQMQAGELVGVYGASGSGKSTLLHILGGLDSANQGFVQFEGQELRKLTEIQLAHLRNKRIGFVFQFYYLLPEFSALENVLLPGMIGGLRKGARAVVMKPKLILADEPTGNLDRETGEKVFNYLLQLNREHKMGMIIVSHNAELLKQLPRNLLLRDGKLHEM